MKTTTYNVYADKEANVLQQVTITSSPNYPKHVRITADGKSYATLRSKFHMEFGVLVYEKAKGKFYKLRDANEPMTEKFVHPIAEAIEPTKKAKVRTAKFKVYVKADYTGYADKDKLIQEIELTHAVAKAWRKNSDWTTVILKSTNLKNHYIVEQNGVTYYFVKRV